MGCYTSVVKSFPPPSPFLWSGLLRVTADTAFILPISMKPAVLLSRFYSTDVNSKTNKTLEEIKNLMTHVLRQMLLIYTVTLIRPSCAGTLQLQRLLKSSALYGGERSPSCSDRFIAGGGGAFLCPLNRRLCQPHCRSWRRAKKKGNCLTTPEINPPTIRRLSGPQHIVHSDLANAK